MQATGSARHVLAHAFFQPFPAFSSEGARTSGHMLLDGCALQTLVVLEGSLGGREGSLLEFLDRVAMPASRRKLRQWLCSPLYRCGRPPAAAHAALWHAALRTRACVRRAARSAVPLAGPGWPGSWPGGWPGVP
jgi:hypothetical protein